MTRVMAHDHAIVISQDNEAYVHSSFAARNKTYSLDKSENQLLLNIS